MKLIFDIVKFLFAKGFKFFLILCLLYAGFEIKRRVVAWQLKKETNLTNQNLLQDQLISFQDQLSQNQQALKNQAGKLRTFITIQKRLQRSLKTYDELEPNFILHPINHQAWKAKKQATQEALDKAIATEKTIKSKIKKLGTKARQLQDDLSSRQTQLSELIRQHQQLTWLEVHIKKITWTTYAIAFLLLCAPLINKLFWYFGPGRWIENQAPYQIAPSANNKPSVEITIQDQKQLELRLQAGDELIIKEGYYSHFSEDLEKQNRFIWKRSAWLISYAAQLIEMTRFSASRDKPGKISLISRHPDFYLLQLRLKDCRGLVLKPQHIIAMSGDIQIRTQWRFFSIHNWMRLVFRHIIFYGSGEIYLALHGGSHSTDHADQAHRLKEEHLVAYQTCAKISLVRNENLWHYIWGKSNLFDYKLSGKAFTLLQNQADSAAMQDAQGKRFIDIILSTIGKILGF